MPRITPRQAAYPMTQQQINRAAEGYSDNPICDSVLLEGVDPGAAHRARCRALNAARQAKDDAARSRALGDRDAVSAKSKATHMLRRATGLCRCHECQRAYGQAAVE